MTCIELFELMADPQFAEFFNGLSAWGQDRIAVMYDTCMKGK